jgi:hypothetical protein
MEGKPAFTINAKSFDQICGWLQIVLYDESTGNNAFF